MSPHPSLATPPELESLRGDRIRYGAVHLDVVDLERSLSFWRDLIGLRELPTLPGETRLGVDDRALVVLRPDAVRPAGHGDAGLYHVAIHLPDATEFARILLRLGQARVPQSPTDHIFSKATYLRDPDGIMLELTLETPERYRSAEIGPRSVQLIDSEGRRRGPTEPLDIASALAPLGDGDTQLPLPSGSYIGHVHLNVPALHEAYAFYRDVIGFDEHTYMAPLGMGDLGAGGRFPHRLAVNDWHGPSSRQPAAGTAGLRRYDLVLAEQNGLTQVIERAARAAIAVSPGADGSALLHDPAGNAITLTEITG